MKRKFILFACSIILPVLSNAQAAWVNTNPLMLNCASAVGIGYAPNSNPPSASLLVHRNNPNIPGLPVAPPTLIVSSANSGGTTNTLEVTNYTNVLGSGWTPSTDFYVAPSGIVGVKSKLRIGTTAASSPYNNYALSVDGSMIAKQCVIQVSNWADYVFKKDYNLPSLSYVESYVNENNHLPGVPSEGEIKTNGVDMGEMNKILMQKVEELTLYMIEMQKHIDKLESMK